MALWLSRYRVRSGEHALSTICGWGSLSVARWLVAGLPQPA